MWLRPVGLLVCLDMLRRCGAPVALLDCLDRTWSDIPWPRPGPWGAGRFPKTPLPTPRAVATVPRRYSRYGLPREAVRKALEALSPPPDAVLVTTLMTLLVSGRPGGYSAGPRPVAHNPGHSGRGIPLPLSGPCPGAGGSGLGALRLFGARGQLAGTMGSTGGVAARPASGGRAISRPGPLSHSGFRPHPGLARLPFFLRLLRQRTALPGISPGFAGRVDHGLSGRTGQGGPELRLFRRCPAGAAREVVAPVFGGSRRQGREGVSAYAQRPARPFFDRGTVRQAVQGRIDHGASGAGVRGLRRQTGPKADSGGVGSAGCPLFWRRGSLGRSWARTSFSACPARTRRRCAKASSSPGSGGVTPQFDPVLAHSGQPFVRACGPLLALSPGRRTLVAEQLPMALRSQWIFLGGAPEVEGNNRVAPKPLKR